MTLAHPTSRREDGSRRTVLVTGASAGIGEALARVFAQRGYDVALTARREDRLATLADDLGRQHGIVTHVVPADLASPQAPREIIQRLTDSGVTLDALVNNAGYGVPTMLRQSPWEAHRASIAVMMSACVELSHLVQDGMVERNFGRIINVASIAGFLRPSAGHTLYAAQKAFLIKFSQSLGEELCEFDINVTALCPGLTYSEFHDVTGTREKMSTLPGFVWTEADMVAQAGFDAVMAGKPVVVPGLFNKFIVGVAKVIPEPLARAVTQSMTDNFRNLHEDARK